MQIRPEAPADGPAIRSLLLTAFVGTGEADLVERLRRDGDAVIALVAAEADALVGHVMLSRMTAPFPALGLGPVAVTASRRRRGIADQMIRAGLTQAAQLGVAAVFVLGNPAYYGRFGFRADLARGFTSPYAGPHFMAVALQGGGVPTLTGEVAYARAFAALE